MSSFSKFEFCLAYVAIVAMEIACLCVGWHILMLVPGVHVMLSFMVFNVPFLLALSVLVVGLPFYMREQDRHIKRIMSK